MSFCILPSWCPACQRHGWQLVWRNYDRVRIAVCKSCSGRDLTIDEVCRAAFFAGFEEAQRQQGEAQSKVENPLRPPLPAWDKPLENSFEDDEPKGAGA